LEPETPIREEFPSGSLFQFTYSSSGARRQFQKAIDLRQVQNFADGPVDAGHDQPAIEDGELALHQHQNPERTTAGVTQFGKVNDQLAAVQLIRKVEDILPERFGIACAKLSTEVDYRHAVHILCDNRNQC
jgi:hypothetical protein